MSCRPYAPFYEIEKNGTCVSNPPKVALDTTQDYIVSSVLFAIMIGGILFVVNTASKQN